MSVIKLVVRVESVTDNLVFVTLFIGQYDRTLKNVGSLCFGIGEYQIFATALTLGAAQTMRALSVIHEDEAFRAWAERKELER